MVQLLQRIFIPTCILLSFVRCSTELSECSSDLKLDEISSLKKSIQSTGPRGFLVVPNPIDATDIPTIQSSDPVLSKELDMFSLVGLLNPQRLENSFLKIRIQSQTDPASMLASPDSSGSYKFPVTDVHYGETMAYYSISAVMKYVEALGFSVVKSRPLYVFVRAKEEDGNSNTINALYSHNYLNPSAPRLMRLYGEGPFAPYVDRDMYWHEFGHLFNESVNHEVGMDYAGDSGAVYTRASSIHECLADYVAESLGNKGNIGKWIARNFSEFKAGDPLRSAEPRNDEFNDYQKVALFDSEGKNLDRYRLAEWCSRVLWDIRNRIINEDRQNGSVIADQLIFSAASLLQKDTGLSQFREAIKTADKELHCGLHNRSIAAAFETRGYASDVRSLASPLTLQASPVGVDGNPTPGKEVTFNLRITNPNSETAQNVRVILESDSAQLIPSTYMQGYADLAGGGSIVVGNQGLGLQYSVFGMIDKTTRTGTRLPYRLRIKTDNGPETVIRGEVTL